MKTFRKVLIYIVLIFVLLIAVAIIFQEKFLFRNTKIPINYQYEFKEIFEEMWFEPEVNVKINALYFKTDSTKRKGLIVYFHNNADNLKRLVVYAIDFTKNKYDILIIVSLELFTKKLIPTDQNHPATLQYHFHLKDFLSRYVAKFQLLHPNCPSQSNGDVRLYPAE